MTVPNSPRLSRSGLWIDVLVLLLCAIASGCSRDRPAPTGVAFTPCRLKGIEIALRCSTIEVSEDRERSNDPSARRIALGVAIVPALARNPQPDAVFVLAGGPGQAASEVAGPLYALFSKLNRDRDIVLVDQRGTGKSNPLSCAPEASSDSIGDDLDPVRIDARLARCAKRLSATADLTRYTTTIAMADLDEVRAKLGYRQIDLWGASYGTRAALEYVRQFPDRVRTMILDGVAPAWQKLPVSFGVDTYTTMRTLVEDCRREPACAKRYPTIAADIDSLVARVGSSGIAATVSDPTTGRKEPVRTSQSGLAQLLRTPLYVSLTASLLPAAIEQAAGGNYDALSALTHTVGSGLEEHLALGMHLSVVCSEDVATLGTADLDGARSEAAKSAFDGRPNPFALVYIDQYQRYCSNWPSHPSPRAYFARLSGAAAAVPTLLLSGGLDPATPPAHATEVERTLTKARHLVAPNVGHGVSMQGCAPDLIDRFVKSADPATIDGACLATIPRPPFFAPIVAARRETGKGRGSLKHTDPMIEVDDLVKTFAAKGEGKRAKGSRIEAVRGVSFTAADGETTGLLGPNGAGKTTTLRMIGTLVRPDRGRALVDGHDASLDPIAVRQRLGVLSDARGLYVRMTARENIQYYGRLRDMDEAGIAASIDRLADLLEMKPLLDRRTDGFSQGERMKVAIARALVHDPQNLILDEPSNGLDVTATRALRALIRQLRDAGKCIVMSSHIMQEVGALADRIVVIAEGRAVANGTTETVIAESGAADLEGAFFRLTERAALERRSAEGARP